MTSGRFNRAVAAVGGILPALLLAVACARSGDPGSDEDLERTKLHDMESSSLVTTPLLPGLGPPVRLPSMGTTMADATDTVIAALPTGLPPEQALVNGARELVRRGVVFYSALCQPRQAAWIDGTMTIPASAPGVYGWPAGVTLAVAWDGTKPVQGPNLRLTITVGRGGPRPISQPSPTPAPSNCPPGLPLGTPAS